MTQGEEYLWARVYVEAYKQMAFSTPEDYADYADIAVELMRESKKKFT